MAPDPLHNVITVHHDKVLIVDFGSQVTQLIARYVREAGVYCEIALVQNAEKAFAELAPKAVILSGGPASVHDQDAPRVPDAFLAAGVPILGICYGQQAMAARSFGVLRQNRQRPRGAGRSCRRAEILSR